MMFANAPQLSDLERFPDAIEIQAALDWSDAHLVWIAANAQLDLVYPEFWSAWKSDCDDARRPWLLLHSARAAEPPQDWPGWVDWTISDRLDALRLLKELIGERDYRLGKLPSIAPPLWRFRVDDR